MEVIFKETNDYSKKSTVYAKLSNQNRLVTHREGKDGPVALGTIFRNVFLPEGYPQSVSEDYFEYQLWDTVQAFASSISGSLATQAVLKGVGVGDESATALAATITWLLRTGAGMAGQILFTWVQGSNLDHNCKKWRLFADIMNDGAMMMELSGPMWPQWMLQPVLCIAGVARSLVGVAGGATRAAITQHQAKRNNISDVSAKDGSQETLVNLLALVVNLAILPLLAEDLILTWLLFFLLTFVHLFANFRAVKALRFRTLNKDRLLILLSHFAKTQQVMSVDDANELESVLVGFDQREKHLCGYRFNVGCSLESIASEENPKIVDKLLRDLEVHRFVLVLGEARSEVDILLHTAATDFDLIEAHFRAFFTAMESRSGDSGRYDFERFLDGLKEQGWTTSYAQLGTLGWRGTTESVQLKQTTVVM